MPQFSHCLDVIKDSSFVFTLVLFLAGLALWLIAFIPSPAFESLDHLAGTVERTRAISGPEIETRLELDLRTHTSTQTIYIRHFSWLQQRIPTVEALAAPDQIEVWSRHDNLGRDFFEAWQITRGGQLLIGYDDMVWANAQSNQTGTLFGKIIMTFTALLLFTVAALKIRELKNLESHSPENRLQFDWLGRTFGYFLLFGLSLALVAFWYHELEISGNIWWLLLPAVFTFPRSLRSLYLCFYKIPQLIILERDCLTLSFVLRSDVSIPYQDIAALTIKPYNRFRSELTASLTLAGSSFKPLFNPNDIPGFELLPETLRQKNPTCSFQES